MNVPIRDERIRLKAFATHTLSEIQAESLPDTSSIFPSFEVRSWSILPMANIPISTGIKRKPSFINVSPKVQRSSPDAGCIPGMATSTPRLPASNPRARVESPIPASMASARITIENNSKGPSLVERSAMGSASCHRANHETSPPTRDAPTPRPSARPGCPEVAIGNPSSVVMMAAGVPGIRKSVALIRPPLTAPTYMATSKTSPLTGSIEKVNGRERAISMVPVKPGIAPTVMPKVVPRKTSHNILGVLNRSIMRS